MGNYKEMASEFMNLREDDPQVFDEILQAYQQAHGNGTRLGLPAQGGTPYFGGSLQGGRPYMGGLEGRMPMYGGQGGLEGRMGGGSSMIPGMQEALASYAKSGNPVTIEGKYTITIGGKSESN